MCGLVAFVGDEPSFDFQSSLDSIRHRGPDAVNVWHGIVAGKEVALGHVRLSILDLTEAANQPFIGPEGASLIVFNGEIYNHHELRSRLRAAGVSIKTRSDTEVLLAAYEQYGVACTKNLNGMFAFVILDQRRKKLFAARDAFGIKPLYYRIDQSTGAVAFASEIRALYALSGSKAFADRALMPEFLANGFLYEPDSGLIGIKKVPPGSYLEMDLKSGVITIARYNDPLRATGELANVEALIKEELRLEVEADVPVGLFFSGGVDSTVLALEAPREIDALFIDYSGREEHPDRSFARLIAKELKMSYREIQHDSGNASGESVLEDFAAVARGTEEPISDYTFAATSLISRIARDAGFKVMLSGMGGDELFAGYPRHIAARAWPYARAAGRVARYGIPLLRQIPGWEKKADRLNGLFAADSFVDAYTQLVGYFSFDEIQSLFGDTHALDAYRHKMQRLIEPAKSLSALKQAMYMDRFGFLSHNLTVTDRSSMLHGLEVRVPFLNEALAAAAFGASDASLMDFKAGKRPLRRLLYARIGKALVERPKAGFNPPLDSKIVLLGREQLQSRLLKGNLRDHLRTELIDRWITEHFAGVRNHTYRLWQLLYLDMWLGQHSGANSL